MGLQRTSGFAALLAGLLAAGCAAPPSHRPEPPGATPPPRPAASPQTSPAPQGEMLAALPEAGMAALPEAEGEGSPEEESVTESFTGLASWYGRRFQGRRTASGERYDMAALTAAHQTLPFGSRVRVTNLDNGRSVVVVINDRGPFVKSRLIDLSHAAARQLGFIQDGLAKVRVDVLAGSSS